MPRGRSKTMTDEELIEAVREHPDRAVTVAEVAEKFDLTPQGVNKRLNELHKEGVVTKKQVGAKAVVWWVEDG